MTFKMAVPNKGRLHDRTIELLLKSGLDLGEDWGRRLYVTAKNQDIEILFVRAQDIPRFIAIGSVDLGITGQDQIEQDAEDKRGCDRGDCDCLFNRSGGGKHYVYDCAIINGLTDYVACKYLVRNFD